MALYKLRNTNAEDIEELPRYEHLFEENEEGEVVVGLENPLSQEEVDWLQADLEERRVNLTEPITEYPDIPELHIPFRKGHPQFWPIVLALLGIGGGITYWMVHKKIEEWIRRIKPNWGIVAGGLTGIIGGSILAWHGTRRRKPVEWIPGFGATGVGTYFTIREFLPKPKPPAVSKPEVDFKISKM